MYIAEITERLLEVNRLLLKYIKDTELTFDGKNGKIDP